ncbi:porin [Oceanobacter mangrovi]|uniref:porin n=1 Tax=Oceanobacter mangrovi TaxID=2862510 RepID=UPI001C8E6C96|nr:porin [Oceanobacter mangrovi]
MHLSTLATVTSLALVTLVPQQAQALKLHGDELELYGTFHISADYMDSGVSSDEVNTDSKLTDGSLSISSNSSHIGLRGKIASTLEGIDLIWQLEQNLTLDGSSSDTFTTRNSYAGLAGADWSVKAGRYDTLAKRMFVENSIFKHTVADYGMILGAASGKGGLMNKRAENMVLGEYRFGLADGSMLTRAMYSSDADKSSGTTDDNANKMLSASLQWSNKQTLVGLAWDHWGDLSGTMGPVSLWRAAIRQDFGTLRAVALLEKISVDEVTDTNRMLDRDARGIQLSWKPGDWQLMAQWLSASSYSGSSDTGAQAWSVGAVYPIAKKSNLYLMATKTDNEDAATYQGVDGTHGDELSALAGGQPKAVSAGFVVTF